MVRRYFALVNRDTPFISVVKINVDKTATVVSALIKKRSALHYCFSALLNNLYYAFVCFVFSTLEPYPVGLRSSK